MGFALAVANRGWDWTAFSTALMDPDNRLGDYYRRRRNGAPRAPHDVARRLERDWTKAQGVVRSCPAVSDRQEMRQELALDYAVLKDEVWTGRTAATDYIVLTGCYAIAMEKGLRELPLATRTVSEKTGVPQPTVVRSMTRLAVRGDLLRLEPELERRVRAPGEAAVYRLKKRQCADESVSTRGGPPPGGDSPAHSLLEMSASNAWRWLGRHALLVFRAVEAGARSVCEVMEHSGVSRRTAFKYLAYLVKDRLLSKKSGEYHVASQESLEELALRLEAPDQVGEHRRRYRQDRVELRLKIVGIVKGRYWRIHRRT